MVWTPINNKFFETFSFLPPLSPADIAKQVDYMTQNGFTPCIEFATAECAYTDGHGTLGGGLDSSINAGYYDNRYWTMWKLPMFGCTDSSQVLNEISECTKKFPSEYIRVVGFDSVRQVQIISFLVHRPAGGTEYAAVDKRSI